METDRGNIINQVAFLITFEKKEIVDALKRNNIALSDESEISIANAVSDHIYDNENLQSDIDKLLQEKKEKFSGVIPIVVGIAAAVGSIFKFAKSAKDKKAQQETDRAALIQQVMAYKAAKLAANSEKSNTGLYVGITAVVVVVAIAAVLIFKKK